ncbi:carboxylesterase/lipase family protein [Streptomyces sp. NPDC054961]
MVAGRSLLLALLLLAGGPAGPASADGRGPGPVVETDRGAVRGREASGVGTFEGIPYAAPPTGPLRWRLPEPAARWDGVRDAGAPGARCVQLPPVGPGGPTGSEDCLFLNVTTPDVGAPGGGAPDVGAPGGGDGTGRRPVMVWFHGGGFRDGAADPYRPGRLASQGGVVVVTVNYRLGVFGLFGHPALGADADFALADQQAALRWVRANAARFGGDPGRVTLFGVSAGGLSVCAHLASPASAGLFHRAILQSGSCSTAVAERSVLPDLGAYTPFVASARTLSDGAAAADRLGCARPVAADVASCLRGLDAGKLATPELMWRFALVSYGDPLLPTEPRLALERGKFHRVPVVQGSNRDEMRLFLAQTLTAYPVPDARAYRTRLRASFGGAAGRIEAVYPVTAYPTPALGFAAALSDASFVCPQLRDSRALARHVPTYDYRFADRGAPNHTGLPEVAGFPFGAAHGFELPYVFDFGLPLSTPQRALSQRMIGYWTRFAATGNPNPPGTAPRWPRSPAVLSLAPGPAGIRTVDAWAEHHCSLWDSMPRP